MILLDRPYISSFLLDTLERLKIAVIQNEVANEFAQESSLHLITPEEAIRRIANTDLLYTNSENSICWIEANLHHTSLPGKIKLFKNKVLFRHLISDLYADYFYRSVSLQNLGNTEVEHLPLPFIVKPAVGFFSLGVFKVETMEDWQPTIEKIHHEIELINDLYPTEVLNTDEFIIEECIEGDEFAVDCYFNTEGKAVVLNIMKHIFSSGKDVNDRVYITSKEIIILYLKPVTDFLNEIGMRADLQNFPAHVEVRINENGFVAPIEVNPLRFGGWCSTPDLAWYAYSMNLYEYLFKQIEPDWNLILNGKDDLIYSNIVLNNSTGSEGKDIKSFDYERLLDGFENPLELRKTDFTKFPLFGFLFCETKSHNMAELDRILVSDLCEFITL